MYTTLPNFVPGFHGCDQSVVEKVVSGELLLRPSENDYDWLGHGMYFWENDPVRAKEYAVFLRTHPKRGRGAIENPAVLGAVIDLGYCLNLMESSSLILLRESYALLVQSTHDLDVEMPVNRAPLISSSDLLLRQLDCAVIELLHQEMEERHARAFDTVRGLFFEGNDLYANAGFKEKNHIQICVRNPNCIKGFFIPRTQDTAYSLP